MTRRLLLALLLCACDERPRPAELQVVPPPKAAALPVQPHAAVAESAPAQARGLQFRSPHTAAADSSAIAGVGQRISIGQVPRVIDLEDGTRVTAEPNTQLWAFALAKSLLLVSGQVHVVRLPDAERAGSAAARIASLAGTLEPSPGADVALRVEVRATPGPLAYRAQLSLTRGSVTWLGLDQRTALVPVQLSAGEPLPKPAAGLQWLTSGPAPMALAMREKRYRAQPQVAFTADVDRALDLALTEQHALRQSGHALLAEVSPRHAALAKLARDAAVSAKSPVAARAYQRTLVEHAQRRQAHAAQLLLAAEQSLLRVLASCATSEPSACASLQAWSERFAARAADLL